MGFAVSSPERAVRRREPADYLKPRKKSVRRKKTKFRGVWCPSP